MRAWTAAPAGGRQELAGEQLVDAETAGYQSLQGPVAPLDDQGLSVEGYREHQEHRQDARHHADYHAAVLLPASLHDDDGRRAGQACDGRVDPLHAHATAEQRRGCAAGLELARHVPRGAADDHRGHLALVPAVAAPLHLDGDRRARLQVS